MTARTHSVPASCNNNSTATFELTENKQLRRLTDLSNATTTRTASNTCDLNTSQRKQQQQPAATSYNIDFESQRNLKEITNSIGDIIKILKSSSSSNSASNSDCINSHSTNQQSHLKLHALKTEIDKTMSEISKFKSEVSTRILNHQCLNENNQAALLNPAAAGSTSSSMQQQRSIPIRRDAAVNTDISMQNAVITVQYIYEPNVTQAKRAIVNFQVKNNRINQQETAKENKMSTNFQNYFKTINIDEVSLGKSEIEEQSRRHRTLTPLPIIESPETSTG